MKHSTLSRRSVLRGIGGACISLPLLEVMGTFDGVPELAAMLVDSPEVEACMTRQWFRFAYGRGETNADNCVLDQLGDEFAASGRNIQDLLIALTQTDAFMYRAHTGEGASK